MSPRRVPRFLRATVAGALVAALTYLLFGQPLNTPKPVTIAGNHSAEIAPTGEPVLDPRAASLRQIDSSIRAWTANLAADPADFLSATSLASQYYARGKLTGSVDDYARAQDAVGRALSVYPDDAGAKQLAALLKYTLHDFAGAAADSRKIYDADHTQSQALATEGDALLELGQYDKAAADFTTLASSSPGPAISARLAHLAELRGDDTVAAAQAGRAIDEARQAGLTGSAMAYYDYLDGYLAFVRGDLVRAGHSYEAALAAEPSYYQAIAGLAHVRAAEGRPDEALALYDQAIAFVPLPEYLAAAGDLHAIRGQTKLADESYATVDAIAELQALEAQVYNRQLAMFDLNHGRNLATALGLVTAELVVRKDIYGWDAYAWGLLANGRTSEARVAMDKAMALGTHDALLLYHAGMIAAALKDVTVAETDLRAALALNPSFDPLQAARARMTLEGLSR